MAARIQLELVGYNKVRAALQGLQRENLTSARASSRAMRATATEFSRLEREKVNVGRRAAQEEVRDVQQAERRKQNAIRDTAREAERSARNQLRASRRSRTADTGARGGLGRGGGFLEGAASVAGGLGISAFLSQLGQGFDRLFTRLEQAAGVESIEEGVVSGQQFELGLTRLGGQAFGELGDEQFNQRLGQTRERILQVAQATNVAPGELLEGLTVFQDRFSQFDFGVESLDAVARASKATGVPMADLVDVLGEAQRQFGLTGRDATEFFSVLQEQGEAGSVTPAQFARTFGTGFGEFSRLTGRRGIGAFREFGALAQQQAAGGGSTEEAATRLSEMMRLLGDVETQRRLRSRGVRVRDERGQFRDINAILTDIATSSRLDTEEEMQQVFRDTQGRKGAQVLVGQIREARARGEQAPIEQLKNVSAVAGAQSLDNQLRRVLATSAEQQAKVGIRTQVSDIQQATARAGVAEPGLQAVAGLREIVPSWAAPALGALLEMPGARSLIGLGASNAPVVGRDSELAKFTTDLFKSVLQTDVTQTSADRIGNSVARAVRSGPAPAPAPATPSRRTSGGSARR